jgi:hypothetical protein
MNSISKNQRLPIYVASIVTILVVPSLLDPINLPKMMLLSLGAGLTLGIYLRDIQDLWLRVSRPLVLISLWFVVALFLVSIWSRQSLFKSLVGAWGRNNGALTYFSLLILFLAVASQKSKIPGIYSIKFLSKLGFFCVFYGVLQNLGKLRK